ncbi:MAG TPA: LuxR C-terminal-related transcriptional regulator, partial [Terriglobales bacterium]|nr:LuxR C-terminal-related transcriptional regulator [Terriglobales bacterium]
FRAGAMGILCHNQPLSIVLSCIEAVHQGKVWASNEELKFVLDAVASAFSCPQPGDWQIEGLTEQEEEMVRLVADGYSDEEITRQLGVDHNTLSHSLGELFAKLHVSTRVEMLLQLCAQETIPNPIDFLEKQTIPRFADREHVAYYLQAAEHLFALSQLNIEELHRQGDTSDVAEIVAAYTALLLEAEGGKRIAGLGHACREWLASKMTEEQIREAEQNASNWLKRHEPAA